MFMTCEFSSELWSFDFDGETGVLSFIDKQSTLYGFTGRNETATVQVHPSGRFVYMNNRGQDDVVWFTVSDDGHLTKSGRVELSRCEDPKDATRAMTLSPSGAFLLVPDRPADIVRAYAVDAGRREPEGRGGSPGRESGLHPVRRAVSSLTAFPAPAGVCLRGRGPAGPDLSSVAGGRAGTRRSEAPGGFAATRSL